MALQCDLKFVGVKEIKKIVYFEPNMNDYGLGTWIQVALNDIVCRHREKAA